MYVTPLITLQSADQSDLLCHFLNAPELVGISSSCSDNDRALHSLISPQCDDYSQAFNTLPSKPVINYAMSPKATATKLEKSLTHTHIQAMPSLGVLMG